jgi:hypothetical protein
MKYPMPRPPHPRNVSRLHASVAGIAADTSPATAAMLAAARSVGLARVRIRPLTQRRARRRASTGRRDARLGRIHRSAAGPKTGHSTAATTTRSQAGRRSTPPRSHPAFLDCATATPHRSASGGAPTESRAHRSPAPATPAARATYALHHLLAPPTLIGGIPRLNASQRRRRHRDMRCASLVVAVEVQAGQKQADINSRSRPFTTG